MIYDFDKLYLTIPERYKLFRLRFKRRVPKSYFKKYFDHLYQNDLIKSNPSDKLDSFNCPIPDGTYSLTMNYIRYCVFRRESYFRDLPNWIAILISTLSLIANIIISLIR